MAHDLRQELSHHVDVRLKGQLPIDAAAIPGRYETNPHTYSRDTSSHTSVLSDLGAQLALAGGKSGLTPLEDGSLHWVLPFLACKYISAYSQHCWYCAAMAPDELE